MAPGENRNQQMSDRGYAMLQLPIKGQCIYEISFYNKDVRSLVKENQSHKAFEDQWADNHIHDVVALNEEHARSLAAERYPLDEGFVINSIVQLKFKMF